MKKLISLFLVLSISAISFNSCSAVKNLPNNTGIESALLNKIGSSLFQNISSNSAFSGLTKTLAMGTKLKSILKTAQQVTAIKSLLTNKFQLNASTLENAFGNFKYIQDIAGFIGKNASSSILSNL